MPLIKFTTGNFNLRNESGKFYAYHCVKKNGEFDGTERIISKAASASNGAVTKASTGFFFSAVDGKRSDIVGFGTEQSYNIEDGEIVKLFVHTRNSYGARHKQGWVFIRARSTAAHRRLSIRLTTFPGVNMSHGIVEGRFDILTLDQVKAEGIAIPPHYLAGCQDAVVRKIIGEDGDAILSPEIAPVARVKKVVHEDEDGEKKEVFIQAKPRRRIGR